MIFKSGINVSFSKIIPELVPKTVPCENSYGDFSLKNGSKPQRERRRSLWNSRVFFSGFGANISSDRISFKKSKYSFFSFLQSIPSLLRLNLKS
ncbi:hypothetical protein LEP1GSC039_3742 [Leptospira santarosai str. 2000027870]|nr:hypothetical protein LEP1GSC039_3742 [Leptospira santarosai str. 2000027870]